MANGLLSFAGGLAKGYMDNTVRNQELERQAKLDAMREQEFALRKRQLEGQIDDQDSERAIKKALLEADQDLPEAQDGTAVQVGGVLSGNTDAESAAQSAQAVRDANAQLSPQEQIPQAEATPVKTVGSKSFLTTPGGLKAAEAYRTEGNTEEGRIKRKADAIRQYRGSDAAQKFLTDWETSKGQLYDAQRNALFKTLSPMVASKDWDGITKAYEHYLDGNTLAFSDEPDGTTTAYQIDKNGNPTGSFNFKDGQAFQDRMYEAIFPDKVMEQRRAAEAKRQEELAKVHAVAPGVELRTGAGGLVAKNNTLTAAEAKAAGYSGGGGYGKSGGGPGAGVKADPGPDVDVNKIALDRWKALDAAQNDVNFTGVKKTPAELQSQAMKEAKAWASQVYGNHKQTQQEAIIHQIMAPARNSAMDTGSQEYAGLYQKLLTAKGQVIPRKYLEDLGYPYPALWERKR